MSTVFARSFSYAFFFHIAIAVLFFVSLADSLNNIPSAANTTTEIRNNKDIVNAVAISENELSQEIRAQQAADAARKAQAAKEANQLAAAKAQALAQIQQAKQQQAALAAQQQADAKKAAAQLAALQAQQKQAAQQLANTQAQAAAAKKAADAQQAAAAKKAADAQQAAAAKKAADAKRLAAQQQAGSANSNLETQNEISRYVGLITQAIQVQWTQLPGVEQQKLVTTMIIRLAPDGTVLQVQNVGSSGNPALDRLALTAVYKASPLPVPADPKLFANFRELKVKFSDN